MSTQQLPRVQPTGGIQDVAQLFASLGPLFGSGETTINSQKTMDPAVAAQLNTLLQSILGGNDAAEMDEMVANILERAKQTFAPIIGQSIASGARAYSDTTLRQLSSEAMARATAEAAQVKLEAINKNNALATQLVGTQANNTGFTTQTQVTGASPAGKLLGMAGMGLQGYSLYNRFFGKKPMPKPEQFPAPVEDRSVAGISGPATNPADAFAGSPTKGYFEGSDPGEFNPLGTGAGGDTGADISALLDVSGPANSLQALSLAADAGSSIDSEAALSVLSGGSFDAATSIDVSDIGLTMVDDVATGVAGGTADAFAGFAADAGAEGLMDVAGDAVGGFLEGGLDAATGSVPIIGPLINVAQGDYGAAAGAVIGSIFGPVGTVVGGAIGGFIDEESVICTHVYQTGNISRQYYVANARYGRENPDILHGYQLWGRPFVQIMKRSKLLYKLGRSMATHHAKYISGEWTIFGFFLNRVIAPLSGLLWKIKGVK